MMTSTRRTRAGGILLEVKRKQKANILAQILKDMETGVIRRPVST